MEEARYIIAQANAKLNPNGTFAEDMVVCRHAGDVELEPPEKVDLIDVSPKQLVSVAAALIPFLENDDANRALDGLEHAAPGRAADHGRGAAGRHRHGRGGGARFRRRHRRSPHRRGRSGRRHPHRHPRHRGDRSVEVGRRHLQSAQVPALEPEHLHQPAAAGARGRSGEGGRDHRRRSVDRSRRAGARAQRARRVHAVDGLQLRGLDPHLRARRARRRVHLDPYRGVRGDGPRHQARAGGDHPRHSQRLRRGAQESRRGGHRLYRRRGQSRATSWWARSRPRARAR